jgi:hypothetical protein
MIWLAWSPVIFAALMTLVCVTCLVIGEWEERLLGGLYGTACWASLAAATRLWREPQWTVGAIDLVYFLVTALVVWRSTKAWPVWAGAMQLLTLTTHLAYGLSEHRLGADAYLTVLGLWSYGIVLCLTLGCGQGQLRARKRARAARIEAEARRLMAETASLGHARTLAQAVAERHVSDPRAHAFHLAVAQRLTELGASGA